MNTYLPECMFAGLGELHNGVPNGHAHELSRSKLNSRYAHTDNRNVEEGLTRQRSSEHLSHPSGK